MALADILAKRRSRVFVGRTDELDEFRANLVRNVDDRWFVLHVSGETGVGKTSFLSQCERIAVDAGWAVASADESAEDTIAAMATLVTQLREASGARVKTFTDAHARFVANRHEMEADPDAAQWVGTLGSIIGRAAHFGLASIPIAGPPP